MGQFVMYKLTKAQMEDFEPFLALKSQKDAIKWSGFSAAPERDTFRRYYEERVLANPNTVIMFLRDLEVDGAPIIGYIQYDILSNDEVELRGSVIKKSYQGIGANIVMSELLFQELRAEGFKKAYGWVADNNLPSVLNAERRGYIKTEVAEIRQLPLLGGDTLFHKWVKEI